MMQNTRDNKASPKNGEISARDRAARALPLSPSDSTNSSLQGTLLLRILLLWFSYSNWENPLYDLKRWMAFLRKRLSKNTLGNPPKGGLPSPRARGSGEGRLSAQGRCSHQLAPLLGPEALTSCCHPSSATKPPGEKPKETMLEPVSTSPG